MFYYVVTGESSQMVKVAGVSLPLIRYKITLLQSLFSKTSNGYLCWWYNTPNT